MFMRGRLSQEKLKEIDQQIPDFVPIKRKIDKLDPQSASTHYGPSSQIPEAIVCLQDAAQYTIEARYAMHEAIASVRWFREDYDPPDERQAIWVGRFYLDNVALRLYSAAEHLANFIKKYMAITLKCKKGESLATRIGKYLSKNYPNHQITQYVEQLMKIPSWDIICTYRNKWVHDKRPIIKAPWISYERRKRWEEQGDGSSILPLNVAGDSAEYTIEELIDHCNKALHEFVTLITNIYNYYEKSELDVLDDGSIGYRSSIDIKLSNGSREETTDE